MLSPFTDRFLDACHAACADQFPRRCTGCKRNYVCFADFVAATRKVGTPKLDGNDDDDGAIGMLSFANCACDGTLALRYEDLAAHRAFNAALRAECRSSGRSEADVLCELVRAVDARAGVEVRPPGNRAENTAQLDVGAAMVSLLSRNRLRIQPISAIALKVERLARSGEADARDVVELLSCDAALASAVVQLANTAQYGRGQAIASLPAAVARVGMREIARVALTMGFEVTVATQGPLRSLRSQLWNRSLLTAHAAHTIAATRGVDSDEAFLCGLLQPMGAIVGTLSIDSWLDATPSFSPKPMHWWMRILEMFRAELGAFTAAQWKLPPILTAAISTDTPACSPASTIGVLNAAVEVTGVIEWTSTLTAQTLSLCESLTSSERDVVAAAIPSMLDRVAAFEANLQQVSTSRPMPGTCSAEKQSDHVHVVSKTSRSRYRVCSLARDALVLEGDIPLAVNLIAHLDVEGATPQLSLWATPRTCVREADRWRITLTPFAVNQATFERWTALLKPHAPTPH